MERFGNDIELFDRIKRGDRVAFNGLFALYYQRLCSFANGYLHNREDVEEVVLDVFFTLWKKRHQVKIKKSLTAYMYTAVKHAALAAIKTRGPVVEEIDDRLLHGKGSPVDTPEAILTFKELENDFERAINSLPPRCKQIFLLKWKDDLTYYEIGEILQVTEKTVENQLVKALQKIKLHLRLYQDQQCQGNVA